MNEYQFEINSLIGKQSVRTRSLFIAEKIDTKSLEKAKQILSKSPFIAEKIDTKSLEKAKQILSKSPLMIPVGSEGAAAIFKYGSVVLMNLTAQEEMFFFE